MHVHRHAGPLHGQARGPALLLRGDPRRGGPARLPVPARDRHGDGAAPRLRVRVVGDRLRRLPDGPGHEHAPVVPVDREDRDGDLRHLRGGGGRQGGRGHPSDDPQAPDRARRRARVHDQDRIRARVLPVPGLLPRRRRTRLPRPAPQLAVHHGLPHAPDHPRRVVHPSGAQLDAGRGHPGGVQQGRVRPRAAGDQHHLLRRVVQRRPPRAVQARREGDRRAERRGGHVHGEVDDGRGRLELSPALERVERRRHGEPDVVRATASTT